MENSQEIENAERLGKFTKILVGLLTLLLFASAFMKCSS